MIRLVPTVLATLFLAAPSQVWADDVRPLYLEISEARPQSLESLERAFTVRLRSPPRLAAFNRPELHFPSGCTKSSGLVRCSEDPEGRSLRIVYPLGSAPHATVARVVFASGEEHTLTLSPGDLEFVLPRREDVASVALQYGWLGMEHIWIGYDHLLFVLCLIWIAGTWKRIVLTITGFTAAHSLTLVVAALDWLRLPVAPVETVIALSVVFLATELARGRSDSLTWRHPVAVSSTFGLLHGLGFAAVLGEIGLPQRELVTGLVAFNLGVELGQVVFATVVVGLLAVLERRAWFSNRGRTATAYLVGVIAAYWLIERTATLFA